jgi:hypothetical protein
MPSKNLTNTTIFLLAVRVNAETQEIIQVQQVTLQSVMMEARQRELNTTHCLGALHHVLQQLTSLQPGNYILRLHPRVGQAELMRSTDNLQNIGSVKVYNTTSYIYYTYYWQIHVYMFSKCNTYIKHLT